MEPMFIQTEAKHYYFDIHNNRIYGPRNDTRTYWHEYSHFRDYSHKWYQNINIRIQMLNEITASIFIGCLITVLFIDNRVEQFFMLAKIIGVMFMPYCLFSFQEEVRAEIYGYFRYKKENK